MMIRSIWTRIAPTVTILALSTGLAKAQDTTTVKETTTTTTTTQDPAAPPPKTTTEKIKDSAGNAVDSVKRGVNTAGEAIKNKYNQAKDHVSAMGIEARVYSRLHWDKALTGSKIDLSAPHAGSIVLTGTVPNAKAQARAILLTNETIGVTEVVDHLSVQSATTTTTESVEVK